jgi:hypothetical protein
MNHCSITSCFGGLGGGFRVDRGGEMVLTDSTMTDCLASLNDGGGIMVRMLSYLHLNRTTVVGCHGHARGGGFFVSFSEFVLRDCSLMECRAHEGGGLSVQDGSTVFVVGSNITRCHGTARGGGVMMNNGVLLLMNRAAGTTCSLGPSFLVQGVPKCVPRWRSRVQERARCLQLQGKRIGQRRWCRVPACDIHSAMRLGTVSTHCGSPRTRSRSWSD